MNLIFQNAVLGWLAALVVVPVLIHLFAKARPPRFAFSNVEAIRHIVRETMRLKRPKDWLLLVIRTLLFAALAFLFLRPVLFVQGRLAGSGLQRNLVLVVDRSASMAGSDGGQSRFARACAEAAELLASLSGTDRANLIWLDADPDAVFPEMGANADYLRRQLSEARVSHEAGNPVTALEQAVRLLDTAGGRREICIVSDFQASQWESVAFQFPPGIEVQTLWPSEDTVMNGAMLAIHSDPLVPLVGEPVQVIAEVGNFAAEPRRQVVTIEIGEQRVQREVLVPAWGRAAVSVEYTARDVGPLVLQASLEEDAFGMDDWRGEVVTVRRALRVGLWGHDAKVTPVWRQALQALEWAEPVTVPADDPAVAAECDILLVAGWGGTAPEILRDLRRQGIPMVCVPADGATSEALSVLGGWTNRADGGKVRWETLAEPQTVHVGAPEDAVYRLFRSGEFGDPLEGVFRGRWILPLAGVPGISLARFKDGAEALFRSDGNPGLVFCALPLDPAHGDWTARRGFLPLFGELIMTLRPTQSLAVRPSAVVGDSLLYRAGMVEGEVRLRDRRGGRVLPIVKAAGDADGERYVSEPVVEPGVYEWMVQDQVKAIDVVNFPFTESDLRPLASAPFGQKGFSTGRATDLNAIHSGIPLWTWLLGAALVLLAMEHALVGWIRRSEHKQMDVA